ncbi:MAG: FG-GAP repeat protein [Ferruginibacter sp.]|nr:FG-GAP repeat protein [Ferruginibacter sp.]
MMYKIFILAVAVSIMPVSYNLTTADLSASENSDQSHYIFHFTNTSAESPFDPEKKASQPWSQNWMAAAQENIRKSEYHFKWEEKLKAYCTPNRKNNLRFFYDEDGFVVEPRQTKIPVDKVDRLIKAEDIRYKTIPYWKVKFSLDKKQVGNGKWQILNNKAEYITEKITVQYINNDDGMRQNFVVHSPLSKDDELKINFSVNTKLKTYLCSNQLQFFKNKTNVLNYRDLNVWDANNKPLTASFQKNKNGKFFIKVDAKNAAYPITIDPLSTTPSAILVNNQSNSNMGGSVAAAGDVNGDGYSDVIVGAPTFDNPEANEGVVFIYHGSINGITATPAATLEINQINAQFGFSVSTAGDVNGDGYSDIIVGSPLYDNTENSEGAAFVYHGSATGIVTTPAAVIESNQAGAQLGFSVACAGDVNNDGFSDIIAGAWLYDDGEANEGVAFVHHGSAAGISTTPAIVLQANQSAANYGIAVACAGDVNGDGFSDVIVGAEDYDNGNTDEGVVFVYHGSAAGLNNTAAVMLEGNQDLSQFGFAVSSAGDVNGDGYSDVIVGAYLFDNGETNEGNAFVYHGSAAGIVNTIATTLQSNQSSSGFGISVKCAGDINGDGFSDIIAGADTYQNGQSAEGAAFVYFGTGSGINITPTVLESNQANARMGRGIGSAGDVNGDGYSDVIIGAYFYTNTQSFEGAAFVYHGSAGGINTTTTALVQSDQASAYLGMSVASAGDVNSDGYSDIIVGAYQYDNGQSNEGAAFVYHGSATGITTTAAAMVQSDQASAYLGISVASAGDVNSDGYGDVIAGAYGYSNGQLAEGAAFIYHGSAAGIGTTPSAITESNQVAGRMGYSVACAGDVNGDGYSDVITGAYQYDNGQADEGAAFIYHGSAVGINTTASVVLECNQAGASFGVSVSGAGDVNSDGYSDVIAGAYNYTNGQAFEGAAFVYHGSATGVNSTAATVPESNQVNASLGVSVAAAGDVNGDGYGDVIAGANFYSNGQGNEGVAFIYHGSASGINITPATIIEGNFIGAYLGSSVAGAGDVNGDGYNDVVIGGFGYDNGQTDEGHVFVHHGSATGISATAAATLESNQSQAFLGQSVSFAGDVNGDGYSDIIAGAYGYDNGQTDEGVALVHHGNNPGNGNRNRLRLYNADLITPINSSNFIFSNFGAGLYARSFLGRDKGKLVWETRLNYNAYSGTPITNSTLFTAQQPAYTDMGLTGVELKDVISKISGGRYTKLRARIKYDPVTAITGQVYSPWRNVSSIIDANNLGVLPIEFISFNASWIQKGKTARLDFKTDKESGICCFEIEKSSDGFNFYSIGTLPAKNVSGIQSYSFIDGNATGKKQFYRIKIKGITGQVDYSNMQYLQNDKATEILVFPNPTTDKLQFQFNKWYHKMNVQVINSAGQMIKQFTRLPVSGQTLSIPVHDLPAGQYWLTLQSGDEKQLLQFVKQ